MAYEKDFESYIEKLKLKDEAAFEAIYQMTKHAVYAIIISIIKDRSSSEDIMQDTYLTMLEKINLYQPGRNFQSWLLTIAKNKAIDYYRHKQQIQLVDPADEDFSFPISEAKGERSVLMREMLHQLTQDERSVFLLKTIEGLKSREIASVLEMPLGTVLWHYNKAIKKIQKIKGGEGCAFQNHRKKE